MAPVPDSKVFFTSGGSDSIDTATKMARRYWQLARRAGAHDPDPAREGLPRHAHRRDLARPASPRTPTGHGELIEDVIEVPWDDADALARRDRAAGADRVAAFFCEPVIGAGGVFPPPDGYLKAAREVCRETGVLFVADEVITGFGRCGDWFASTRFGLEPDIITCAKGITSGYLPMGAVVAAPWVAEPFWAPGAGMWRHGYTYSGHATVAAAALANLDIMEREDLCGRALDARDSSLRRARAAGRPRPRRGGPRRRGRAGRRPPRARTWSPTTRRCRREVGRRLPRGGGARASTGGRARSPSRPRSSSTTTTSPSSPTGSAPGSDAVAERS